MCHRDQWKAATVLKQVGGRSYLVKTPNGHVYRRNRKHLRCTEEAKIPQNYEDGEDEFSVSGTADHDLASSNSDHEEHLRPTETMQTMTRSGRVIKPSSRYTNRNL